MRPPLVVLQSAANLSIAMLAGGKHTLNNRKQGAERVAAVGEGRWCSVTEDIRRAPQQDSHGLVGMRMNG